MKTKKSLARRVKITGTGKILHAVTGKRHLKRNKTAVQKRRQALYKSFSPTLELKVKKRLGVA